MPRITPIEFEQATPEMQAAWTEHTSHAKMTNMKRTLAHNAPAFHALMEWYPMRDALLKFLPERAVIIFAHAISAQTDCLICSTFFRRILKDWGENPDELKLDETESLLVDYGRQLAREAHGVNDALFARLRARFNDDQIVALTGFGAIMFATNMINNALHVEMDEYLFPYRKA